MEVGSEESYYYPSTPKEFYSRQYFECVGFIISSIKDRFGQPGYRNLQELENLLLKADKGEDNQKELGFVVAQYGDDFVPSSLETQSEILTSAFTSSDEMQTLAAIKTFIKELSPAQQLSISKVCTVLKLIMVMPATNVVSERSASVLRRVKTFL